MVNLDHGIGETRAQLGRQLDERVSLETRGVVGTATYLSYVSARCGRSADCANVPGMSFYRTMAPRTGLDLAIGHAFPRAPSVCRHLVLGGCDLGQLH